MQQPLDDLQRGVSEREENEHLHERRKREHEWWSGTADACVKLCTQDINVRQEERGRGWN